MNNDQIFVIHNLKYTQDCSLIGSYALISAMEQETGEVPEANAWQLYE